MRRYIFTDREADMLNRWLRGELRPMPVQLRKLLSRIRHADELVEDIQLFLTVREKLLKKVET